MDITELLASARLAEETVPVCLRPDLLADYAIAVAALNAAEAAHKTRGSMDAADKLAAAAAVDGLREQMLTATATFTVRALPRRQWTKLVSEHPPREGDADDERVGFNRDTFYDVLVRLCVVEPQLSEEQWEQLESVLSAAQWATLRTTAWRINHSDVDVPFLLAASRAPTTSGPSSEPLNGSASASSGSTAGSRSRSTSTTSTDGSSPRAPKRSGTKSSKG